MLFLADKHQKWLWLGLAFSSSEENITQLLNDKDSENTKNLTKHHRLIFESYLKEKNIRNPLTAVELAAVLRKF